HTALGRWTEDFRWRRWLYHQPASGLLENDMRLLVNVALAAMTTLTAAGVAGGTQSPQGQGAPASPPATGGTRSGGIPVPTITLGPGLTPVPDYNKVTPPDPAPQIPEGFVPLFNGKDLSGWHVSQTARSEE